MSNLRFHGSTGNVPSPRADELRFATSTSRWLALQFDRWANGRHPTPQDFRGLQKVTRALADVVERAPGARRVIARLGVKVDE